MKVYNVKNKEDYIKVIKSTLEEGSENTYGESIPLFDAPDALLPYGYEDEWKYYDKDTGKPKWDTYKYEFPDEMFEEVASFRLNALKDAGLNLPFVVVVGGEKTFDRISNITSEIFYETKLIDI